jgi:hypothetical protein
MERQGILKLDFHAILRKGEEETHTLHMIDVKLNRCLQKVVCILSKYIIISKWLTCAIPSHLITWMITGMHPLVMAVLTLAPHPHPRGARQKMADDM